jgi:hypothetical protein
MRIREIMRLVESTAQLVSVDMLPAVVKQDILDMLLGPNHPPGFEKFWMAEHGIMSYDETYVSQFLFGDENLTKTGGYDGNTIKVRFVALNPAVLDNSRRSVSDRVVSQYSKLTTSAPPILVRQEQGAWKLVEGGHRLAAAKARGDKVIQGVDVTTFFTMTAEQWQGM